MLESEQDGALLQLHTRFEQLRGCVVARVQQHSWGLGAGSVQLRCHTQPLSC
jgi:hypothetical protein